MSDQSATQGTRPAYDVLTKAGIEAGVPTLGAKLIRDGVNVLYRLPGRAVARIGPAGSYDTAAHLVRVSHWLATADVPAVRLLDGVRQPTVVGDRPVTWWEQLPDHRHATPVELGATLKRLHALTPPDTPPLPVLDPFTGLDDTITTAPTLTDRDRTWLTNLLTRLRHEYAELQPALSRHVIHGDAWQGNLAVLEDGLPVLMDLDHIGLGPRE